MVPLRGPAAKSGRSASQLAPAAHSSRQACTGASGGPAGLATGWRAGRADLAHGPAAERKIRRACVRARACAGEPLRGPGAKPAGPKAGRGQTARAGRKAGRADGRSQDRRRPDPRPSLQPARAGRCRARSMRARRAARVCDPGPPNASSGGRQRKPAAKPAGPCAGRSRAARAPAQTPASRSPDRCKTAGRRRKLAQAAPAACRKLALARADRRIGLSSDLPVACAPGRRDGPQAQTCSKSGGSRTQDRCVRIGSGASWLQVRRAQCKIGARRRQGRCKAPRAAGKFATGRRASLQMRGRRCELVASPAGLGCKIGAHMRAPMWAGCKLSGPVARSMRSCAIRVQSRPPPRPSLQWRPADRRRSCTACKPVARWRPAVGKIGASPALPSARSVRVCGCRVPDRRELAAPQERADLAESVVRLQSRPAWLQTSAASEASLCKIEAEPAGLVAKLARGRPVPSCERLTIASDATLHNASHLLTGKNRGVSVPGPRR
jgi:hypothetical protein